MEPRFTVRVYEAEEGGFWAECLELPGCFTQGESLKEVEEGAREAITAYLESLAESRPPSKPAGVGRQVTDLHFAVAPA